LHQVRRALVLPGGGYVASSWEIGLIAGLADAGLDIRDADTFIGTSAGARVALDLTSGRPLHELYERRLAHAPPSGEAAKLDWSRIRAGVDEAKAAGGSSAEILKRYGSLALSVAVGETAGRRERVAAQLPMRAWPEQTVLIPVVDGETGERRVLDRHIGVDLVDAVIATTASFGATPPLIDGHRYIDGGYYSSDNADLAMGCERVLILALRSPPHAMRLVPIESAVEALRAAGAHVEVVHPDDETLAALAATGGQMNPASGPAAAIAGRAQGRRVASEGLAAFWR